jgi:hypothetical protein
VPGPESYLSLDGSTTSYARTPDTGALDITGDIDIRVEATADWYASAAQGLIAKWISATNQRSYMLRIENGALWFNWSTTGADNFGITRALPALPRKAALRATLDVNNGVGGYTVTMYWAQSLNGPWTTIGAPFTSTPIMSIFAGTAPLEISPTAVNAVGPVLGRVHRAEVRNGLDGTVVAAPDARALAPGAASFTDSAGRPWTLGPAAAVSNREYRFVGEVSSWPARWDVSGRDVWVSVEAAGILRRMGQGRKALASTMRRRIPSYAPVAYWPMEDGSESVLAYSPIAGVAPLTVPGMSMSADDTLQGSLALPTIGTTSSLTGRVPAHTATGWQIEFVYHIPTGPGSLQTLLEFTTTGSPWTTWRLAVSASTFLLTAEDGDGATTTIVNGVPSGFFGGWARFQLWATPNGANLDVHTGWVALGDSGFAFDKTVTSTSAGRITGINTTFGSGLSGAGIGHLTVFGTTAVSTFTGADTGFAGETALDRIRRLATEEAGTVALSWADGDTTALTELMGPQRPGTLQTLIDECAETDGGILSERRDRLALHYRDRTTLYNQPVAIALDYTARGEVPPPLEPVEDDQRLRNDVTITRIGGSSGRSVVEAGPLSVLPPPQGVGIYDEAVSLSLAGDGQPQQIAAWRTHLGTWDEARYPVITMRLHTAPHLIPRALAMDIGDRLTIANPPPWLAPGRIDQHIRGYTETLGQFEWSIAMNCAPAGPWEVGVRDDAVRGLRDTAGAQLAAAATSSATTLSVATTVGPLWVTAAPNSITDPGFEQGTGTWQCTRGPSFGSVSRETSIVHSGAGAARVSMLGAGDAGSLNVVDGATTAAGAGEVWTGSAWVYNGTSPTAPAMRVGLVSRDGLGAETVQYGAAPGATLGAWTQRTVTATTPAGTVAVRLMVEGRAGFWTTAGSWWLMDDVRLARTDTLTGPDMPDEFPLAITVGGETVNVHGISGTTSPQTFYVNRSVNGITKAQTAGTGVSLARPAVRAL